ncbi:hypothetical protein C1Y40_01209 [Mycobacterium talmoniae]|uniref:Uncharacterized protein n=1 Tax=Mycobacterium talmoniae TaxID=1858794 RepID=A0A2S8BPI4_9MYCO|nr:hypothetical protein C1Y40_01209 [Mycobacterium talmoniae]
MPGQDAAHIGAVQHLGQRSLVAQFHQRGKVLHAGHRRVVHGQNGAERGGLGQLRGQPLQLLRGELSVVVAGHRGVQHHDPQPGDLVHPVHRGHRRRLTQQVLAQRGPVVVVTHHPDELGAKAIGQRFDQFAQRAVGVRLAGVGEIPGEHQGVRARLGARQPVQQLG